MTPDGYTLLPFAYDGAADADLTHGYRVARSASGFAILPPTMKHGDDFWELHTHGTVTLCGHEHTVYRAAYAAEYKSRKRPRASLFLVGNDASGAILITGIDQAGNTITPVFTVTEPEPQEDIAMNTTTEPIFTPSQTRRNREAIAAVIAERGDTLTASDIPAIADDLASKYVWEVRREAFRDIARKELDKWYGQAHGMESRQEVAAERVAVNRAARKASAQKPRVMASAAPTADDTPASECMTVTQAVGSLTTVPARRPSGGDDTLPASERGTVPAGYGAVICDDTIVAVTRHVDISASNDADGVTDSASNDADDVQVEDGAEAVTATDDADLQQGQGGGSFYVAVLQEDLKAALARVKPAVARRGGIPALQAVHLSDMKGRLALATADLTIAMETFIDAQWMYLDSIAVNHAALAKIVASFKKGDMEISSDGVTAIVRQGVASFTLPTVPLDTMPDVRHLHTSGIVTGSAEVEVEQLARAFRHTATTAANDVTRPVLTAVHAALTADRDAVRFASADGFRMSMAEADATQVMGAVDAIIPAAAVKAIETLIRKAYGNWAGIQVRTHDTDTRIVMRWCDTIVSATLVDGTYPDVQQIVPKTVAITATVDREALLATVKQAAVVAKDNNNVVYLTLLRNADGNDTLEVSATVKDTGASTSTTIAASVTGDDLMVAFDARYMLDTLSLYTSERVSIGLNGPNAASIWRCDSLDTVHVIMPMVIGG